jgi:hypothetical protein
VSTVVAEYKEGACGKRRDEVDALADESAGDTNERAEVVGEDEWSRRGLLVIWRAAFGVWPLLLESAG